MFARRTTESPDGAVFRSLADVASAVRVTNRDVLIRNKFEGKKLIINGEKKVKVRKSA